MLSVLQAAGNRQKVYAGLPLLMHNQSEQIITWATCKVIWHILTHDACFGEWENAILMGSNFYDETAPEKKQNAFI